MPSAYSLFFTNTVFDGWASYSNVITHAYFTDCTFSNVLKPYGDTTLTGCTFTGESLYLLGLEVGETITLENCTYNGVAIDAAVLTATMDEHDNVILTCDNDLLTITDGTLVLKSSNP